MRSVASIPHQAWASSAYCGKSSRLQSLLAFDCPAQNSAWGVLNLQTPLQGLETGRDVFASGKKKAFSMLVLCSMKRPGLLYPNQPQRGKVPKKAQIGLLLSGSTSPKGKRSMDIQSSSGV